MTTWYRHIRTNDVTRHTRYQLDINICEYAHICWYHICWYQESYVIRTNDATRHTNTIRFYLISTYIWIHHITHMSAYNYTWIRMTTRTDDMGGHLRNDTSHTNMNEKIWQPITFAVSFLPSQISIDHLVFWVSFATFRWKQTNAIELGDWVGMMLQMHVDMNVIPYECDPIWMWSHMNEETTLQMQ